MTKMINAAAPKTTTTVSIVEVEIEALIPFPRLRTLRIRGADATRQQQPGLTAAMVASYVNNDAWAVALPAALQQWWTTRMHLEQRCLNLPITDPPTMIFLSDSDIAAFNATIL